MRGIVWGLTSKDAIIKLKAIEEDYRPYTDVVTCRKTKNTYEIIFENGDHWIACNATEAQRGRKCNVSYIDARIDQEIINRIITPCTIAYPFHAFSYFYDFVDEE